MNAQIKGGLMTVGLAYLTILLYHKGMLPMAKGPKKSDAAVTTPGE